MGVGGCGGEAGSEEGASEAAVVEGDFELIATVLKVVGEEECEVVAKIA